ncbi:MAG TPA: hypothetical protein VFZ59_09500 [Verrucomicrobiae bacterium]|nr:hypothetical protein [Verrucomicrobiae bacterium]
MDCLTIPAMDLYVFPSVSLRNIQIGVDRKMWAVAPIGEPYASLRAARSRAMPIGAAGLFYCSAHPEFFTAPFLVESQPEDRPIDGVWDERRFLPFAIRPLGDPSRLVTLAHAYKTWQRLKEVEIVTDAINLGPATAFDSTWFPRVDWDLILEQMHINSEEFEDLFQMIDALNSSASVEGSSRVEC